VRTLSTAAWVSHNLGPGGIVGMTTILSMKATKSARFGAVSRLLP
jgi:hypothetical protein